uniref:Uncharacterized protein n=1 Tax=Alexandrium monilatum TaxID=311494 RepID=A0A7S4QAK9_9DINO
MVQVGPEPIGPAVQLGRPVVQGTPVVLPSQPLPRMQATVVRVASPQGGHPPELVFVRAPPPEAMGAPTGRAHLEARRAPYYHDSQDTACLQIGTLYACCCPCGLCVGCTLWSMYKDRPLDSPQRLWSQYALGAGVFNLACNLAATAVRTLAM